MVDVKISEYVLHLTEYGLSLWGDWYVTFYYEDTDGLTQYGSHHDKSFDKVCEWAGISTNDMGHYCDRYDYRK